MIFNLLTKRTMNKQEMIDVIYKKVANKELSFGCKVKFNIWNRCCIIVWKGFNIWTLTIAYHWTNVFEKDKIFGWYVTNNFSDYEVTKEEIEIIGHPVLIWTILKHADFDEQLQPNDILDEWWDLERPIEEKYKKTIKYIYDVIK